MKAPQTGWTTKAKVVNVVDGDTVDVEIRRTVRVRLIDCWAPECRTRNIQEKVAGIAASNALKTLLPINAEVTLQIPTNEHTDIAHIITMGRVLGHIWNKDTDVAKEMVELGHATVNKHYVAQ